MMMFRSLAASSLLVLLIAGGTGGRATATPAGVMRASVDVPGAPEPHTPPALNRSVAFRYYAPDFPPPSTVLVLSPGLNSGPNTVDLLARALIAAHGPGLEVWVVSRRAALLQDRRGVDAALEYRNPDFALGYYYGDLAIDGHVFHRIRGADAPYAAYWGLDVHLRDIRAIVDEVQARFPDARVVLGGHSLGAILAAFYAGYDFSRPPGPAPPIPHGGEGAGARDLYGLLLLDGLPFQVRYRVTPARYLHGFRAPFVGSVPGVEALTAADPDERAEAFAQNSNIARTKDSIVFDVISAYAYLRPDAASYFPFYPRLSLPITNSALVAAVLSAKMQPDLLIRNSVAVPVGEFRRVPDPTGVNRRGLLELRTGRPAPGERLIYLPAANSRPARVDLQALLAAIMRPGADFTEWYFPWRLVLDIGLAANLDTSDPFSRQFMSLTRVRETALPVLIIGAGRGLIRSPRMTEFYRSHIATPPGDVSVHIIPDYYHLEIETAAANPAVPLILDWLRDVVH